MDYYEMLPESDRFFLDLDVELYGNAYISIENNNGDILVRRLNPKGVTVSWDR